MKIFKQTSFVIGIVLLLCVGLAQGSSLSVSQSFQTVPVGDIFDVQVGIAFSFDETLSTYDINITFNPQVLSFYSVKFGDQILGDQLDLFGLGANPTFAGEISPGVLNIFELSLDSSADIEALQAGAFILATISFEALANGVSDITPLYNYLGDANGDPLDIGIFSATVEVVPEPSPWMLLGVGLLGIILKRKRKVSR